VSKSTQTLTFAAYQARRVAQTCTTFANWPVLLRDMTGQKFGRGAPTLEFVTRRGARLRCPNVPGARLPMFEQFADDCYDVGWLLGPRPGEPLHVLDVGSHVGAFATNLALAGANVHVECYEPSPETARFLRENVERNGLSGRVRVHEQALGATSGSALLDDNSGGSVHNGLVVADHRLVDGADALTSRRTIEVETTTFDRACAIAPAPFDLVKLDCEGGEYQLVYASSPASWASVRRVVMEYHPVSGESWDELRDWLAGVGLRVVRHEPGRPGLGTAWLERTDDPAHPNGGPR
jgi:FkbM family methyltransferase